MLSVGAWAQNVAKIGTTEYATLAEAFAAITDNTATTIEVLTDCSGNGIIVPTGRDITVNFNNYTYTVNTDVLAGSYGTKSQCFQLLRDSKVTFNNGTIVADNAAIKMIIQNYSDLTLTGMTINATSGTNNVNYVVSNNNGNTVFGSGTTITAKDTGVAFDVYSFKNEFNYTGANVTIDGATINGKIEVSANNDGCETSTLGLVLNSGTINGTIAMGNRANEATITKNETFSLEAPADYKWNTEGKLIPKVYVAQIESAKYETLTEAITAATAGQTVSLLDDVAVSEQILIENNLTINGNGHTITSSVTDAYGTFYVNTGTCDFTITDATLDGNSVATLAVCSWINNSNDGNNITLTDCTVKNFTGFPKSYVGAVYAFSHSHLTLNNCTFTGNTTPLNTNGASGADVWAGAAATVNVNGGSYKELFVNSNSSNEATITISGNATVEELAVCASYKDDGSTNIPTVVIDNATVTTLNTEEGNPIPSGDITIQNGGSITNTPATEVAKILNGKNTKAFATLNDAIEEAAADQTITLLADATATKELPANVTIDADGKNLTLPTFSVADGNTLAYAKVVNATNDTYKVTNATYTRTGATGTQWGTACLPFSIESAPAGFTLYTPSEVNSTTLTVTEASYPLAVGTPVIFFKSEASAEATITSANASVKINATPVAQSGSVALAGTFTQQTITENLSSIYYINGDKFHQAKVSLTVPAYRAYIQYTGSGAKPSVLNLFVDDNETTGVEAAVADMATASTICDINGRLLSAPQKGINIIKLANGKTVKLIIK